MPRVARGRRRTRLRGRRGRRATSGSSSSSGSLGRGATYAVQPGDTLRRSPRRRGCSVSTAGRGQRTRRRRFAARWATRLTLSGRPRRPGARPPRVRARPAGRRARPGRLGRAAVPHRQRVSASEVGSTRLRQRRAAVAGRGDRLAGERLQQRDRVASDARGVMQILPGTWDCIQHQLAGGDSRIRLGARQRPRGRPAPARAARCHRRRHVARGRRLLPGAALGAPARAVLRHPEYVDNVMALSSASAADRSARAVFALSSGATAAATGSGNGLLGMGRV